MADKSVGVPAVIYPADSEILSYAEFEIEESRPAEFIETEHIRNYRPIPFRCPRCKEKLPGLDHGEDLACPECNLRMQLYGNALHIWVHQR